MADARSMRVLALEPFYGGSHRAFLDGWAGRSRQAWTILGLPDHSWKWRMRHAPSTFAGQLEKRAAAGEQWDVIFCSDMLALAEFRGLAPELVARLPAVVYFHENQLTYPVREEAQRDLHFAFTNLITAWSADAVWFNSHFHRDDFLSAAEPFLRRMPDFQSVEMIAAIREKSSVQWPGIEGRTVTPGRPSPGKSARRTATSPNTPLHIVWAARWEHDKNPDDFFAALDQLASAGVEYRVSVLGESFREVPPVFAENRTKLADRIVHWGYQESRDVYAAALQSADVFVSTARHEFFGLAAVEAMAAGCIPLLPRRLAYPELVTETSGAVRDEFLYDGTVAGLVQRLLELAEQKKEQALPDATAAELINRFDWQRRVGELDAALVHLVASRCRAAPLPGQTGKIKP